LAELFSNQHLLQIEVSLTTYLQEEVPLWCALLGSFNQGEVIRWVHYYLQEKLGFSFPENRVRRVLKEFLQREKITYRPPCYVFPGKKALEILSRLSREEWARRIDFVKKWKKPLGYGRPNTILARAALFLPELLPEIKEDPLLYELQTLGAHLSSLPSLLSEISPEILDLILEGLLYRSFALGEGELPAWMDLAEKESLPLEEEDLLWKAFQGSLLCGKKDLALQLRERLETPWKKAYAAALLAFFSGEEFSPFLEEAENLFRESSRRRYFTPDGPLGLLAPLMRAAKRNPLQSNHILKQWKVLYQNVPSLYREWISPLGKLLRYLTTGKGVYFLPEFSFSLETICSIWALFWDRDKGKIPKSILEEFYRTAAKLEKRGHLLWALEIYGFINEYTLDFQEEFKNIRNCTRFNPLFYQFLQDISWEERLQELEKLLLSSEETGKKRKRLIWLLDLHRHGFSLQPLEQRLLAQGLWSKGRKVSLKRIFEGEYPDLTEHDRRVVQYLREEVNGYGSWARTFYTFSGEVLEALAGHPLVFDARTLEHLVVEKRRPRLKLERVAEGLKLQIEPPLSPENRLVLEREGNRLRVFRVEGKIKEIAEILGKEGLILPLMAQERVQKLLPELGKWLEIESEVPPEEAREVPPEARLVLFLYPREEGLFLRVRSLPLGEEGPRFVPGEGKEEVLARVGEEFLRTRRDLAQERERLSRLTTRLKNLDALEARGRAEWLAPGLRAALELLEALEDLSPEDYRLLWPEGKTLRVEVVEEIPRLELRQAGDWFKVEGEIPLKEEDKLPLGEILSRLREEKSRFIPLERDRFLILKEKLYRGLRELSELAEIKANRVELHPLRALALSVEEGLPLKGDARWREWRARVEEANRLFPEPPAGLLAELRPYQLEGYRWLMRLYALGFGACLADDMGLGKTVQTLALILARAEKGPSLVVAPASVLSVWKEEVRKFAPGLKVISLGEVEDREKALSQAGPGTLVLLSYGLLQQEETARKIEGLSWNVVVLDEAQHIKNYRTKRARHAYKLRARFRLATTGTPVENRLEELWSLFRFITPGLLGSFEEFRRRFIVPIEKEKDSAALKRLRRLIRPFLLRRTKAEVLEELPPRTEITIPVELSSEEQELYHLLRLEALREIEGFSGGEGERKLRLLAHLTRLRLFCASPRLLYPEKEIPESKLSALLELLEEILSAGHRVLVFSQFVKFLRRLEEALGERNLSWLTLEGSTPVREREKRVQAFMRGEAPIFLLSLKAGGFGLNLTAADYVILCDPWWNPAVEIQATDRVHRLGQTRPVTVYRLVTRDTVEEKVCLLQEEKRELAEEVLSETSLPSTLDLETLLSLLR